MFNAALRITGDYAEAARPKGNVSAAIVANFAPVVSPTKAEADALSVPAEEPQAPAAAEETKAE